jgi:hypothetical protein
VHNLDLDRAISVSETYGGEYDAKILSVIASKKASLNTEMVRFQDNCDRFDNLYYANVMTRYGADHWPEDPNLKIAGKSHVSVNNHPTFVDVPAALQAVTPIENVLPSSPEPAFAPIAAEVERLYFAWKEANEAETKYHKGCVVKGLYGKTAAKVVWDEEMQLPVFEVIEQPRNLYLGYSSNDYSSLEWACYTWLVAPYQAIEEWGLDVNEVTVTDPKNGEVYALPWVTLPSYQNGPGPQRSGPDPNIRSDRDWLFPASAGMLEVNDYWCRKPAAEPVFGQKTPMTVWNYVTVGNVVVQEAEYPEYGGTLPFVPLYNTFVPGVPEGRSDLFDIEQLLREKDERISSFSTMIGKSVGRQYWQAVGPEMDQVPANLRPKPDGIITAGPGARIEPIQAPTYPFEVESYLARIDKELTEISGLNDLLRGLAPSQALSSSKAINMLVSQFETRIQLRRALFYKWREDIWNLAKTVWGNKQEEMAPVLALAGKLVQEPPSLNPRDDMETTQRALNLVNGRTWSLERAMDATGVEDPEAEKAIIRQERQDVGLNPEAVQAQAALMAMMQQMQMQQAAMQQQMGPQQPPPGEGDVEAMAAAQNRQAADGRTPEGVPGASMQGEEDQAVAPPGSSAAFAGEGQNSALNQTLISEGEAQNRVLLQQPLSEE